MRFELPVLRRCCFCLPLRRGLLAWGYFKLLAIVVEVYFTITVLYLLFVGLAMFIGFHLILITLPLILLTLLCVDFIFTVIFLIAAHKKKHTLMEVYYYYLIILVSIIIVLSVLMSSLLLSARTNNVELQTTRIAVVISSFLYIFTHCYFLVLVRSAIKKIKDQNVTLRFVNNTGEIEVC
ncbi:uncharacterized protein LOC114244321 [Bombyx mandarina]|uniref:Uncharacterized protein n=2 Tax=Bombyx TaxID=7090 RepID=A0A8R2DL45_BOMMO|nr:uncharacterized protein LOC110385585 [Bombyx mori]XP_028031877.1 uncharacterized protein LOC114244321 [Bombyx mandarina]